MSIAAAKERIIVKDEEVCGGAPVVRGTRIRVADVMAHYRAGKSPEEIAELFGSVDLGDVHAAISYYYKHRKEIERNEKESRQLVKEAMSRHPSKV